MFLSSYSANTLTALDATNGAVAWDITLPGYVTGAPAAAGGVVYVGTYVYMTAVDEETGAITASFYVGFESSVYTPAVGDGILYFATYEYHASAFRAIDSATGATLWTHNTGDNGFGAPVVANGVVYAVFYPAEFGTISLDALDASTGDTLWVVGSNASLPIVADGSVVFNDSTGLHVYGLP